jgi:hypothetical protein
MAAREVSRLNASRWLLWAIPIVAGLAGDGESDLVQLKGGKELKGRVVYEDERLLVLRRGTRDTEIALEEVQRVQSLSRNLDALLDQAERCESWDPRANELLAAQAAESGLAGEAGVFWWRVLAREPGDEEAHRSLGHRKRGSGWAVPLGSRTVELEKRTGLAGDWGSAWEFSTLHYRLRTNLALDVALDLAVDLERYYRGVYALFGSELRLLEVCTPMKIHVHADRASYPENANEAGHYDEADDTVHVNASAGLSWATLAHEAMHQLLYDTAIRERSNSGSLPAWLNEGLAEYVAGCTSGQPWRLELSPGARIERHFQAHAGAKKPLSLGRVLNLSAGDFFASSERDLKYAQAYTLVHFCLHGGEGRYRPRFIEFLRGVYRGQGSSTDFKNALSMDARDLEDTWQAYAGAAGR